MQFATYRQFCEDTEVSRAAAVATFPVYSRSRRFPNMERIISVEVSAVLVQCRAEVVCNVVFGFVVEATKSW